METVFTEASLHADSFKIIQSAFGAAQQERLEARSQVYLDQLKVMCIVFSSLDYFQ